jgi:hypothetical protein
MPYSENSAYNKFQVSCDCGTNDGSCGCNTSCGCCPIGTIEVKDSCGKHVACLLPSDYAQYFVDTIVVPEGFVKAFNPTTGDYVGLLTVTEYAAYLALFAPAV